MPSRVTYHHVNGAPTSRENARDYDRYRQPDKHFYSSTRWAKVRRIKLSEQPLCEECERQGRVTLARHVHHVQPRKDRPDLAYDLGNLESICIRCHNAKETR